LNDIVKKLEKEKSQVAVDMLLEKLPNAKVNKGKDGFVKFIIGTVT
jgi:hypothetical protein